MAVAGAISKQDLKRFLEWAGEHLGYPSLRYVNQAAPTAELEPLREGVAPQTDEQVDLPRILCLMQSASQLIIFPLKFQFSSQCLWRSPSGKACPPQKVSK